MYYKREVMWFVEGQVLLGRKRQEVLKNLEIKPSTYHGWKKQIIEQTRKKTLKIKRPPPLALTPPEKELIVKTQLAHPTERHRKIQGILQMQGIYISQSSVFKVLKENGLVEHYERRECPWKKPRYAVRARNLMWGADWTKIKINHVTWQLLAVVDFFSRKIVAWDIMPSVESKDIRVIYRKALDSEGVGDAWLKPRLRLDQGSPNTARFTKGFFLDMGVDLLSLARIRRPTDNALTERFFGSLKQEEVYIVGSYPDEHSAREEIGKYIAHYNSERPHQALWNFTPDYVHEVNNKSEVLAELESLKFHSKKIRREYWALAREAEFQQKMIAMYKAMQGPRNITQT